MARKKYFDWYQFLAKRIIGCEYHNHKNLSMFMWVSGRLSQGQAFDFNMLIRNPWDCSITVDFKLGVTSKSLFSTKKKAAKLILPRRSSIDMAPGEISLITAPGYISHDCKNCSISPTKTKVKKHGRGRLLFRRKGKTTGLNFPVINLLLLPLGFVYFQHGFSIDMKIAKDPSITQDHPDQLVEHNPIVNTFWSLENPSEFSLLPWLIVTSTQKDQEYKDQIERICTEEYTKWCSKKKLENNLHLILDCERQTVKC